MPPKWTLTITSSCWWRLWWWFWYAIKFCHCYAAIANSPNM